MSCMYPFLAYFPSTWTEVVYEAQKSKPFLLQLGLYMSKSDKSGDSCLGFVQELHALGDWRPPFGAKK